MRLKFENKLGTVEMSGGGNDAIRITGISGLGVPAYERRTFTSYDFDGSVESVRRLPARLITVGGDILGDAYAVSDMLRVLSEPCTMTIISPDFERIVYVSACEAAIKEKNKTFTGFALSLTCDDPYFYDAEATETGLYVREKLITSETTLPAMFCKRETRTSIYVSGDRDIEPVITIMGNRNFDETEGRIVIENKLTGAVFTLLYVPETGEIITVDVLKRTITSDINGNIIGCISDDSFLSELVIGQEGAVFVTTGYGAAGNIGAYISYRNKHLEAIV